MAASLATCAERGGKSGGLKGDGDSGLRVTLGGGARGGFVMVTRLSSENDKNGASPRMSVEHKCNR